MAVFNQNKFDINHGIAEWKNTPGAILVDVRTVEEYKDGHIDGSINIPLGEISTILEKIPDRNEILFVHCQSGIRSAKAVAYMVQQGYVNVKNIGGLNEYDGELVK